jgi:hypothetical protein
MELEAGRALLDVVDLQRGKVRQQDVEEVSVT